MPCVRSGNCFCTEGPREGLGLTGRDAPSPSPWDPAPLPQCRQRPAPPPDHPAGRSLGPSRAATNTRGQNRDGPKAP